MEYELKLRNGARAVWEGKTAEIAARRFVDCHPNQTVMATRRSQREGVFMLGRHAEIKEGER